MFKLNGYLAYFLVFLALNYLELLQFAYSREWFRLKAENAVRID